MFNRISSFSSVLSAAVHKGEQFALVADSVASAAEKYASNGGAKPLIQSVITACTTTDKGKQRAPAVGTLPALILSAMNAILADAEGVGARPKQGDDKARAERAAAYGESVRATFVASFDAAQAERKAKREASAAEKKAEQAASGDKLTESKNGPVVTLDGSDDARALLVVASMDASAFRKVVTPEMLAALRSLCDAASVVNSVAEVVGAATVAASAEQAETAMAEALRKAKTKRVKGTPATV